MRKQILLVMLGALAIAANAKAEPIQSNEEILAYLKLHGHPNASLTDVDNAKSYMQANGLSYIQDIEPAPVAAPAPDSNKRTSDNPSGYVKNNFNQTDDRMETYRRNLIVKATFTKSDGDVQIDGTVTNTNPVAIRFIQVQSVGLSSNNEIIEDSSSFAVGGSYLEPGQTAHFHDRLDDRTGKISSVNLTVDTISSWNTVNRLLPSGTHG
jgi:hypothetical protein